MLWRLPASVRSLTCSASRAYSLASTSTAAVAVAAAAEGASEPLKILFCGSDSFSIASLRALNEARHNVPGLIQSIDVVHRPAKRYGRGLKFLREVPIKDVATKELSLATHVIDTFTGWTPPVPINLVIAVSFGLLVPPRILGLAKYGGLNVHPSLLPDLRGPAPIEHAILKRRARTGVSIQTLHPKHFDQGTVLAQTPEPWSEITRDVQSRPLEEQLASAGAKMLVDVLQGQLHIPPHKDAGWYASSGGPIDHAPKITKQDSYVDFGQRTVDDILTMQRALGETWCMLLPSGDRLILHRVAAANTLLWDAPGQADTASQATGIFVAENFDRPLFRAACGKIGIIENSTYAGSSAGSGNAKLIRMLAAQETQQNSPP